MTLNNNRYVTDGQKLIIALKGKIANNLTDYYNTASEILHVLSLLSKDDIIYMIDDIDNEGMSKSRVGNKKNGKT